MSKKAVNEDVIIRVIPERCPQNHACPIVKKCPEGSVNQEGFKAPTIDQEKCIRCLICVKICPYKAFQKLENN